MQSPASLARDRAEGRADMIVTKELLRTVSEAVEKGSLCHEVQAYLEIQQSILSRMVSFGLPIKAADARVLREYVEIHR